MAAAGYKLSAGKISSRLYSDVALYPLLGSVSIYCSLLALGGREEITSPRLWKGQLKAEVVKCQGSGSTMLIGTQIWKADICQAPWL